MEYITITKSEYDKLMDSQAFLNALEAAGVDNWGGYGDAVAIYDGENDE